MELIHPEYEVENSFGKGTATRAEAHRVWESWAPEHRQQHPEDGFVVWDVYAGTDRILMATTYLPVADTD